MSLSAKKTLIVLLKNSGIDVAVAINVDALLVRKVNIHCDHLENVKI
jgi:hypothetical protein